MFLKDFTCSNEVQWRNYSRVDTEYTFQYQYVLFLSAQNMRFNDRIESQVLRQRLRYYTEHFFQRFDNKGNPLKKHFIQTLDK